MRKHFWNQIFRVVIVLLGLWLAWDLLAHFVAEILWFIEVGYLSAFLLRLQTQFGLFVVVGTLSTGFLFTNFYLANRLKYPTEIYEFNNTLQKSSFKDSSLSRSRLERENITKPASPYQQPTTNNQQPILTLRSLLPLVLILILLIGLIVLHYGKIALSLWQIDFSLSNVTPSLPSSFSWASIQQLLIDNFQFGNQESATNSSVTSVTKSAATIGQLAVVIGISGGLVMNPQFGLIAIAIILSSLWSLIVSSQWGIILESLHPTGFNTNDPLFGQDISFYLFRFPVWQLLDVWLGGLVLFGLVATALIYLLSGNSISEGKFPGFSSSQLRHLYGLGSTFATAIAFRYWLYRYELLYSVRGVAYGASYTEVNAQLPINTGLSFLTGAIAIVLLLQAICPSKQLQRTIKTGLRLLGFYLIVVAIAGVIIPAITQRLGVQPNELARERPYIERSIALTRDAFDLDSIDTEIFNPEGELTRADIDNNILTIGNIRLWDTRPILQTNRQLQRIRPYYEFPDADIDRYTLRVEASGTSPSSEEEETNEQKPEQTNALPSSSSVPFTNSKQQVFISPRELDYNAVPEQAKTWVNQHLTYTHGYGFTLSPVNTADQGGLPTYFIKDIGTGTDPGRGGNLSTSSPLIRDSIPIGAPRIYYGELTDTYVMTSTKVKEFDYPSGEDNVYNTYDGNGGISIGSTWRKLLFAQYLKDWQMLFTRNFTPQTKLLFRRNINQRIRAIAPFLRYDDDPYLVAANTETNQQQTTNNKQQTTNYLYWIIDGYTTSDRYPYSDPGKHEFNYIRNSVKVVIDAYNGDIQFYIADPDDPIIKTWSKIFPNFFKPLDGMPETLRSHIRYPGDLFSIQSERLLIYHMTDPQVFYNREDLWRIPQEIYGGELQAVAPYYLIMKLPTATSEEFILLNPYTPASRNNLIAWLAGRSDGDNYGKLLLYQFPKQELVYGPEQIEALINQDPIISQQISLWNRQGSGAIQGNLLVIPIERSLLYVEPLYLEAEQNSLPTLVRVIVVYENRIVMAETLEQALQGIFKAGQESTPTIIRPVEEPALP